MSKTKKTILSISLLTSNRKDTIRKCLDSLQALRDTVASELIIVDTGCDEQMRGIIEEYTDRIVKFEWCGDFAKARNAGLKESAGEWFMFIDDDEWFLDTESITRFFTSGMYKGYDGAYYTVRNYLDFERKTYKDSKPLRIRKRTGDLRFEGIVHEELKPLSKKWYVCNSIAEHFGYCYVNEAERDAHIRRNISLLEKAVAEDGEDLRMRAHLLQETIGAAQYERSIKLAEESLAVADKLGNPEAVRDRATFYVGLLMAEMRKGDIQAAAVRCKAALEDRRLKKIARMALYRHGAEIYYKDGAYKKSEECARLYLAGYDKLVGKESEWVNMAGIFIYDVLDAKNSSAVRQYLIGSQLKQGSTEGLKKYFDMLEWDERVTHLTEDFQDVMLDSFLRLPYDAYFVHCAQLLLDERRQDVFQRTVWRLQEIAAASSEGDASDVRSQQADGMDTKTDQQSEENKSAQEARKVSPEAFSRLRRIFAETDCQHPTVLCLKIQQAWQEGDEGRLPELYRGLLSSTPNFFSLDEHIWEIAYKGQIPLEEIFLHIPFDTWRQGTDQFCRNSSVLRLRKRRMEVLANQKRENVRYDYFICRNLEAELIVLGRGGKNFEDLTERLGNYLKSCLALYGPYYTDKAFFGEMEMLPPDARLMSRLLDVLRLKKEGRHAEAFRALDGCMHIYVPLDRTLANYKKLYGESLCRSETEITRLGAAVKQEIRKLISIGQQDNAVSALTQLNNLMPWDRELAELEELCNA